jgi:hypothetical protein
MILDWRKPPQACAPKGPSIARHSAAPCEGVNGGQTTCEKNKERSNSQATKARHAREGGGRGKRRAREHRAMPGPDRAIGEGLHAIIKANAPALSPRLWYGMPAYAKDGKIVCFFQRAQRFKT